MGNKAWSGYNDEDRRQADMEKGIIKLKEDKGFYGHMKVKGCKKVKIK